MYKFTADKVVGNAAKLVYVHPTYTDYGVAFKVEPSDELGDSISCDIVYGNILSKESLRALEDFSAPLDVNIWALSAMRLIQNNSVNNTQVDIDNLFTNHGGIVVYEARPVIDTSENEPEEETQQVIEPTEIDKRTTINVVPVKVASSDN